jgi:hypothetical protein
VDPRDVVTRYLEIADDVMPGLVEGLYLVGSVALDDWVDGVSDVDFVAVLAEPATDDDVGYLRTIHALLHEEIPSPAFEGVYLAWGDLVVEPATGLHRPWVLDGQVHHDGDCFEINPITWYTLATQGVLVRGPAIARLDIPTDVEARVRFVLDNLSTYWTDVRDGVSAACDTEPDAAFGASSFVWCALGALRLHYTAFTGEVTSKRGAAEHGLTVLPEHLHDTVRAALDHRQRGELDRVDTATMSGAVEVISWVLDEVAAAS